MTRQPQDEFFSLLLLVLLAFACGATYCSAYDAHLNTTSEKDTK